jgi:hypothetical protein
MKTLAFALVLVLPACGGSSSTSNTAASSDDAKTDKPPATSASAASPETAPADHEKPAEFPTKCAKKEGDLCLPPVAFNKYICSAPNASSLVLAMFAKGSPWQRMYLARDTEAWDASGGVGSAATKLAYDEEVLVLAFRPPANTGGMVVSGANGAYDVIRWDGVCASLNDGTQQKLLEDGRISLKEGEMKKACKGVSRGQSTPACDRAQKSLSKAVVNYIRNGGAVPTPKVP